MKKRRNPSFIIRHFLLLYKSTLKTQHFLTPELVILATIRIKDRSWTVTNLKNPV